MTLQIGDVRAWSAILYMAAILRQLNIGVEEKLLERRLKYGNIKKCLKFNK